MRRLDRAPDLAALLIVSNCARPAGPVCDAAEGEQVIVGLDAVVFLLRPVLALNHQLDRSRVRNRENILDRIRRIVPVANQVDVCFIGVDGFQRIISFLGQAHRVHLAACAGDLGVHAPVAGGIREDPVAAAAVLYSLQLAVPLLRLVRGVLLVCQVIAAAGRRFETLKSRRIAVPDAPARFFAVVLAFYARLSVRFQLPVAQGCDRYVNILRHDIVAAPYRNQTVRGRGRFVISAAVLFVLRLHPVAVVLIDQVGQRLGFGVRHALVADLPKENRGVVPVINNHIPERVFAHLIGQLAVNAAHGAAFAVHAGLKGDDAVLVGNTDLCRRACAVAPADKVAARVLHQLLCIGVHPVRICRAQAGPFVGRLLAPALELDIIFVQEQAVVICKAEYPDAKRGGGRIDFLTVHKHLCHDFIEIRVLGGPEFRVLQRSGQAVYLLPASREGQRAAGFRADGTAIHIPDFRHIGKGLVCVILVLDLGFHHHIGGSLGFVPGIHIGSLRVQEAVQRQGDMQRVGDIKGRVAVQPAVIRMPMRVVPAQLVL